MIFDERGGRVVMKRALLVLIALVSLWPIHDSYSQEKIRIGYGAVSIQSGLVWIAKQRGLYAKYGISPEIIYIPGGSTNIQALISGNLDLTQLTAAPGVAANLEGADIVYIAVNLDKLNYQLVTRPEIQRAEQLRGAKLGISRFGSSADFGLRVILKRLGLDPAKDVTILQIGGEPERLAALMTGNIDGTVMNAPFGAQAEKQKLNVLADSLKMGIPFFNTGLLGSRRTLEQQERKVLNFLRVYLEAIKILKTDREFSIRALSQFTRVKDLKIVEEGYDYFKDEIQAVPYPSLEAMQAVVTQMAETNPKANRVDAKTYISERYLRQLEDEGFVKRLWGK